MTDLEITTLNADAWVRLNAHRIDGRRLEDFLYTNISVMQEAEDSTDLDAVLHELLLKEAPRHTCAIVDYTPWFTKSEAEEFGIIYASAVALMMRPPPEGSTTQE
jgi:hypothetical protein